MSFEGIWKVEMMGPYGWEKITTAFLEGGRYLGAGSDHHSVGAYEVDGENISIQSQITQHGKARTVFGETKKRFDTQFEGKLAKSGKIVGVSHPVGDRSFEIRVRMKRLAKLG